MPRSVDKNEETKPRSVFKGLGGYIATALIFSVFVNLLLLVSPIYMLQVYDRILTSGSVDTLIWITAAALFLLSVYAVVEAGRRRVFALAGDHIETSLNSGVFDAYLRGNQRDEAISEDVASLQRIQGLLQSSGLSPFFDAPFIPAYLGLLFWVHPALGLVATAGAGVLFAIALGGRAVSNEAYEQAIREDSNVRFIVGGIARQRSTVVAMGMGERLRDHYRAAKSQSLARGLKASQFSGMSAGISRSVRQMLQIGILGLGGYLAVNQQVSAGAIVAGSILMGRALAPIDQLVQGWRNIVGASEAWKTVRSRLQQGAVRETSFTAERPEAHLEIRNLTVMPQNSDTVLVHPFSAAFEPGSVIAIFGRNGCGKTTLLDHLAGATEAPAQSDILYGGQPIRGWDATDRGRFVGYLPQAIDLLPGTVAQNIARFDPNMDRDAVIQAARAAGAEEMILGLSEGYNTQVDPRLRVLSAGQAQQIGLARALYGEPAFLFLDEPTSNLDSVGIAAFSKLLAHYRDSGRIVFMSTHDIRLLRLSDSLLILRNQTAAVTDIDVLLNQEVAAVGPAASRRQSTAEGV